MSKSSIPKRGKTVGRLPHLVLIELLLLSKFFPVKLAKCQVVQQTKHIDLEERRQQTTKQDLIINVNIANQRMSCHYRSLSEIPSILEHGTEASVLAQGHVSRPLCLIVGVVQPNASDLFPTCKPTS